MADQIFHFRIPLEPMTAAIKATSREEAVQRLQAMLPEKWDTDDDMESSITPGQMDSFNEYLTVWFDEVQVTAEMIDDDNYRPVVPTTLEQGEFVRLA
jgi:hypothetical protein